MYPSRTKPLRIPNMVIDPAAVREALVCAHPSVFGAGCCNWDQPALRPARRGTPLTLFGLGEVVTDRHIPQTLICFNRERKVLRSDAPEMRWATPIDVVAFGLQFPQLVFDPGLVSLVSFLSPRETRRYYVSILRTKTRGARGPIEIKLDRVVLVRPRLSDTVAIAFGPCRATLARLAKTAS